MENPDRFFKVPQWNPFIRWINGETRAGGRIEAFIQPSGARGQTFKPIVLKAEPNRELRWLGRLLVPGLFDGKHIFIIEPLGAERVCFIQREIFTGMLVPLLSGTLDRGFEEMNQALKNRAEKG